ncbi:hypothetical protein [Paraburkholderia acidipaludis]|uniref:hypothetical protein n=1 Tax=Paraburkholderia acidipaludis TaxID=660537 RepID=UPI0004896D49|nr:hypothetical protein [Paraburkholderia acidipaludis]
MPYHTSTGSTASQRLLAALGALLLVCAPLPALSADTGLLHGTPLSKLDRPDLDALESTVLVVLNTRNDGETSRWTNNGSDNRPTVSATLTPEGTTIKHRRTCRFVAITVNTAGKTGQLRPQYCRTGDASWERQKAE